MGFISGVPVADNDSFASALKRKSEIQSQLQALRDELKSVDEYIALHKRLFGDRESSGVPTGMRGGRRERNVLPPEKLVELSLTILQETGRPLTRSQLAREIERRGIPLAGVDPVKNLGTILWRSNDRIQSVPGRGYWITGRPIPSDES